jgi:hypothetical protein
MVAARHVQALGCSQKVAYIGTFIASGSVGERAHVLVVQALQPDFRQALLGRRTRPRVLRIPALAALCNVPLPPLDPVDEVAVPVQEAAPDSQVLYALACTILQRSDERAVRVAMLSRLKHLPAHLEAAREMQVLWGAEEPLVELLEAAIQYAAAQPSAAAAAVPEPPLPQGWTELQDAAGVLQIISSQGVPVAVADLPVETYWLTMQYYCGAVSEAEKKKVMGLKMAAEEDPRRWAVRLQAAVDALDSAAGNGAGAGGLTAEEVMAVYKAGVRGHPRYRALWDAQQAHILLLPHGQRGVMEVANLLQGAHEQQVRDEVSDLTLQAVRQVVEGKPASSRGGGGGQGVPLYTPHSCSSAQSGAEAGAQGAGAADGRAAATAAGASAARRRTAAW